jgi:preprotein translocase subunit YajC
MMNWSWLGLGGGIFTWIAGLVVICLFIYIGFNIFFKILNVIFNLIFLIIFVPLFIASYAFEKTWSAAKGLVTKALDILFKTAVKVVAIAIEVAIFTTLVSFAYDNVMRTDSVKEFEIMAICEAAATDHITDQINKQAFKDCFIAQRAANPEAFANLDQGFSFLLMLIFIFLIYHFLISKKLQEIINSDTKGVDHFKFGDKVKESMGASFGLVKQLSNKVIKTRMKPKAK